MTSIESTSGIYKITCTVTSKFYIGSAINLQQRWWDHRKTLRNNTHHNQYLQRAWNKYGEDAFTFEVLEWVLPISLTAREQYWFNKLKPFGNKGFNIAREVGSSFGITHTPEAREKISASRRGKSNPNMRREFSAETIEKIRQARLVQPNPMAGVKRTPEWTEKLRQAHIGLKANETTRERMRQAQLGRKHSEETKAKMRQARIGYRQTPEAIEKIRAAHTGRPGTFKGRKHSEESREKMNQAHQAEMKSYLLTDPDGRQYSVTGIRRFAKEHGLDHGSLIRVAKGRQSAHKGWKASYLEMDAS